MSDAVGGAPPSPVVESCREDRLLSAAALRLSKHDLSRGSPLLRLTEPRARSPISRGLAALRCIDFCTARRMQQSCAADDAAGARQSIHVLTDDGGLYSRRGKRALRPCLPREAEHWQQSNWLSAVGYGLTRMSANSSSEPLAVLPAATMRPWESIATSWPESPTPWKSEVRNPSPLKVVSSVPSGR